MKGLLIGYGSIGRRHLANLVQLGVREWAVVRTAAGTLPFDPPCPVRTYSDLAEALDAEAPSFAVVANPTALHLATALACVRAGCDLLIEKPVSATVDGLEELGEEVARRGTAVLVGFQFRFDPGLRRLAELLGTGAVGQPLHVRAVYGEHLPGWHPWEDWRTGYAARRDLGGGVHHTLCHPLDYLRMLFGDPFVACASLVDHGPLDLDVAEAADVTLGFPGGLSAQVHLDYWSRPSVHRMEVVGTEGTIVWDHVAGELRLWEAPSGGWRAERVPGLEARDQLFVAEARHLLEVVARQVEPRCTLEDGIRAVELCASVERAAARSEPLRTTAP